MRELALAALASLAIVCPATAGDNFKVCAAADDADFHSPRIVLPPGLIFESWGRLIGDLTNPQPDTQSDNNDHYAVAITRQTVLTTTAKCATTTALVVLSKSEGWKHPVVAQAANLFFQALDTETFYDDPNKMPNHLGEYIAMGILNGKAIADIKDTETLP